MLGTVEGFGSTEDPGGDGGSPAEALGVTLVAGAADAFDDGALPVATELGAAPEAVLGAEGSLAADVAAAAVFWVGAVTPV